MNEQSPLDRQPTKENRGPLNAEELLIQNIRLDRINSDTTFSEAKRCSGDIYERVLDLLVTNPELTASAWSVIKNIVTEYSLSETELNREGEIALQIATYLHSLPDTKNK